MDIFNQIIVNDLTCIVRCRYGEDASVLTENAAYALGNAALTAHYVSGIGPKAVRITEERIIYCFDILFRLQVKWSNKQPKKQRKMLSCKLIFLCIRITKQGSDKCDIYSSTDSNQQ